MIRFYGNAMQGMMGNAANSVMGGAGGGEGGKRLVLLLYAPAGMLITRGESGGVQPAALPARDQNALES